MTENEDREIIFQLKQECERLSVDYHPDMLRYFKVAFRYTKSPRFLFRLLIAKERAVSMWIDHQLRLYLPGLRERLLSDPECVEACKMEASPRTVFEHNMARDVIKKALKRQGIPVSSWLDPDTHKPCGIPTIVQWVTDGTSDTDGGMANG